MVLGSAAVLAASALLPHDASAHPITIGLFALGYLGVVLLAMAITRVADRAARAA